MAAIKVHPILLFTNNQASSAATFYVTIFQNAPSANSHPLSTISSPSTRTPTFTLNGQPFNAINIPGPPLARAIPPNISMLVRCTGQREVDYFWAELIKGGRGLGGGMLIDKFGVVWHVYPEEYLDMRAEFSGAEQRALDRLVSGFGKFDVGKMKMVFGRWWEGVFRRYVRDNVRSGRS
ncbi:hypothetical protein FQN49_003766 [Arthroderma sp. PD_2]|nr:hypothetical protein FQN49_003766 [Arthroderma sp. PD_2]